MEEWRKSVGGFFSPLFFCCHNANWLGTTHLKSQTWINSEWSKWSSPQGHRLIHPAEKKLSCIAIKSEPVCEELEFGRSDSRFGQIREREKLSLQIPLVCFCECVVRRLRKHCMCRQVCMSRMKWSAWYWSLCWSKNNRLAGFVLFNRSWSETVKKMNAVIVHWIIITDRGRESVGLIAAQSDSQHSVNGAVGGQRGQRIEVKKKKKIAENMAQEETENGKISPPELSRIIMCSSHNDLQYSGQNGSHFKITPLQYHPSNCAVASSFWSSNDTVGPVSNKGCNTGHPHWKCAYTQWASFVE